jgi:hypothetical protein
MAAMAWRFPRDAGELAGAGAFPLALCAALAVLAAARAVQKAAEGGTDPSTSPETVPEDSPCGGAGRPALPSEPTQSVVGPGRRPGRAQDSRDRPGFEDVPPTGTAGGEGAGPSTPLGGAWRLPALCVAYMAGLPWLGFIASTALFTAALLAAMGFRRAGRALAFGFALAIVLHWVFAVWMQVPLPEGWPG